MTTTAQPRALLLTGPYGAGKSALVAEIAGLLEGRVPFAAIDLDWLAWYDECDRPRRWAAAPAAHTGRQGSAAADSG